MTDFAIRVRTTETKLAHNFYFTKSTNDGPGRMKTSGAERNLVRRCQRSTIGQKTFEILLDSLKK